MRLRRLLLAAGFTVAAALLVWLMFVGLPRWYGRPATTTAGPPPPAATEPGRKIKARLFYVTDDGARLTAVEREVPYAEPTVDQAREIITAQIAPVADPLVSAIPPSTTLRALFVTSQGEAFVDLSGEVVSAHPGGSTNELLTIYTIVDALTLNLPAVTSVQLLVDGKEMDTLAGHVDLRRPLPKNLTWLDEPAPGTTEPAVHEPAATNQERGTPDAIR
jgi:spore germination protein GerM